LKAQKGDKADDVEGQENVEEQQEDVSESWLSVMRFWIDAISL
jgi:hypothetical protein